MDDDEKTRLGAQRMLALRDRIGERRANLMLVELKERMLARGHSPDTVAAMHVIGDVTDEEWGAACSRIPE